MTSTDAAQMDFLTPSVTGVADGGGVALGVVIDHRQFLRFVARGWLEEASEEPLFLGVGRLVERSIRTGRIKVAVWFESHDLRTIPAQALREGVWTPLAVHQLRRSDEEVAIKTPLPIGSVRRVAVSSQEDADRLIAMMRNFQNVELSTVPVDIVVGLGEAIASRSHVSSQLSFPESSTPPLCWDAMRGAFAMATWAVPAIDPWLDILCGSLVEEAKTEDALHFVNAPWWRYAPWHAESNRSSQVPTLWRSALAVFHESRTAKDWRPLVVLDELESRCNQMTEPSARSLAVWKQIRDVVTTRATVMNLDWSDDILALSITLVLLRDSPDSFATWREDWPGMPPGAWWTGAVLSGWKCGFERLAPSFRPASDLRKRMDSWTWRLGAGPQRSELAWLERLPTSTDWHLAGNSVELLADGQRWGERGQSNRGQWYRLDLESREALAAATVLAKQGGSDCFDQVIRVQDSSLHFEGEGSVRVDSATNELRVEGRVEFALAGTSAIKRRLNVPRFRKWLAASRIPNRLSRPPLANGRPGLDDRDRPTSSWRQSALSTSEELGLFDRTADSGADTPWDADSRAENTNLGGQAKRLRVARAAKWPEGLSLVEGFVTLQEEPQIVHQIDSSDWQDWLSRRVQHYGWRYDYKKRRVDVRDRLGPLPVWASELALRLLSLGLVREMPDQVIVNEYLGSQGIGKHIDCPSCFRGPVVTVSLLETWAMVLRREIQDGESKVEIPLPRGSATILDGPARMEWSHEIPKRIKEDGRLRHRRLSVTFRKVADS